jgi:hypothetical protein
MKLGHMPNCEDSSHVCCMEGATSVKGDRQAGGALKFPPSFAMYYGATLRSQDSASIQLHPASLWDSILQKVTIEVVLASFLDYI